MRTLILASLVLSGCVTTDIEGIGKVGWRTELAAGFTKVPVKEHPTTPNEWQAKANSECVDMLMSWKLPDSNFGWKHQRMNTICVFSFERNECICNGPTPITNWDFKVPNEARFSTLPGGYNATGFDTMGGR